MSVLQRSNHGVGEEGGGEEAFSCLCPRVTVRELLPLSHREVTSLVRFLYFLAGLRKGVTGGLR